MHQRVPPHRSSIGLDANILALLMFLAILLLNRFLFIGIWVLPFVFYLIEKESAFVRQMSLQAAVLSLGGSLAAWLIGLPLKIGAFFTALGTGAFWSSGVWDTLNLTDLAGLLHRLFSGANVFSVVWTALFGLLTAAVSILCLVLGILGAIRSYQYVAWDLPIVSPIARKLDRLMHKPNGSF